MEMHHELWHVMNSTVRGPKQTHCLPLHVLLNNKNANEKSSTITDTVQLTEVAEGSEEPEVPELCCPMGQP